MSVNKVVNGQLVRADASAASQLIAVDTDNILGGGAGAQTNSQAMFDELSDRAIALNSSLADDEDAIDAIVNLYGAKQLIKYPYYDGNSKAQNSVTFTVNNDLSVSLSGTSSGYAAFNFCSRTGNPQHLPTGRYTISGGYSNKIVVSVGKTGSGGAWQLLGSSKGVNDDVVFDVDESDDLGICIEVTEAGVATDGITIKQLLTDSRIKDRTFASFAMTNRELTDAVINHTNAPILLATAVANQTFAAQLTALKSTYDTLTDAQKMRTFIGFGDYTNANLRNVRTNGGDYSGSFLSGAVIRSQTVQLNAAKFLQYDVASGGTVTFTDRSAETNSMSLKLYLDN